MAVEAATAEAISGDEVGVGRRVETGGARKRTAASSTTAGEEAATETEHVRARNETRKPVNKTGPDKPLLEDYYWVTGLASSPPTIHDSRVSL